jgi:hypothetical protein
MKPSGSKSVFCREELLSFPQDYDDGYLWPSWEETSFAVHIFRVKLKLSLSNKALHVSIFLGWDTVIMKWLAVTQVCAVLCFAMAISTGCTDGALG